MKFNALIVDDEPLARKDLKALLSGFENVIVTAEANNLTEAKKAINETDPDLIFLDIKMPGESGFDLLKLENIRGKVIFVTAFDEYAIRAFEVNARDYLLKPVSEERLRIAIDRLEEKDDENAQPKKKLLYDDRVYILMNNQYQFVKISGIRLISAADDYTEITTIDGISRLTQKSMNEWESRLPENHFARIHRSTIVNLNEIIKIEPWFNNASRVYLQDLEKPLVMSRRYSARIKEIYG